MSINKVTLLGNVGKDPEIVSTMGGGKVAKFSLATSTKQKVADQDVVTTEWHNITAWNNQYRKMADLVQTHIKKGMPLYVEGRIHYGSYEKNGVKHYTVEIVMTDMHFIGKKEEKPEDKMVQPTTPQPEPKNDFPEDDLPF